MLLDRHPEALTGLTLPDRSREEDPPKQIPVNTPWRAVSTVKGVRTWETTLPVRLRTLFFKTPPDDLAVYKGDARRPLRHAEATFRSESVGTWGFGPTALSVRREADEGPPAPGEYKVFYSRATEREKDLNLASSELSEQEFLFRSLQVGDATRHGLLLPAPAAAEFLVDVPEGGVLDLGAMLVPPEAADLPPSDGARLVVTMADEDGSHEQTLLSEQIRDAGPRPLRASLADRAGSRVRLRFATDPGATTTGDYVFLVEPTVYAPQADPPRVVLIFIDTLRQDHLSIYGYARETTPNLEAWSKDAAVFDQARSVAPWTLPSTRTMLSGVVPERWKDVDALPERFAKAGWTTAFIAGNTYLSSNFEIDRGWGLHRCINWPRAEIEVDRGLEFLAQHADRPVFLLVHLMDQHLPYVEPLRWRFRFAGRRPAALEADYFLRSDVMHLGRRLTEPVKQFIRDRYDNNLAYVDHELARLLAQLDIHGRDTVMLLADHGEEFWDHGGFEHGQSIHEELVHIPMILAGPGISPARVEEPVSMLDVSPTLASAAGLALDGMSGWPLQGVVSHARAADFAARPQAFGRPLYGQQVWGSLLGADKYISEQGRDRIYNLKVDPTEDAIDTPDAATAARMRLAMTNALGTPSVLAWRLSPGEHESGNRLLATLEVPSGIDAAWAAGDPMGASNATVNLDGDRVIMAWASGNTRPVEVYVVPSGDPTAALSTAQLSMQLGSGMVEQGRARWSLDDEPPAPDGSGAPLISVRARGRTISMTYATVPIPYADSDEIKAFDAEVKGELHALGYLEDAGEQPDEHPRPPKAHDGEAETPDDEVNEDDGSAP